MRHLWTSGRNTYQLVKDDLKCYISPPNNESKLLMRISDNIIEFVFGYATCATFWWCTNTFGRAVYILISPLILKSLLRIYFVEP